MTITNVALIGGTGTLGAPVLRALESSPFTLYILNRASSTSTYPSSSARVLTIPDDLSVDTVASVLRTHHIDALVITIAGRHVSAQKSLIDAAFHGGVKRIIPAEFGSCDSADEKTNDILPLMKGKKEVRDYLVSLENKARNNNNGEELLPPLTWTSLITGHFFDWGLTCGLLKFDVKRRKAYLLDGGDIKFSASNLDFVGKAVVKVLQREEQTRNKLLYVQSHRVTQLEVLAALEKATGERFERVEQSSGEELEIYRPKMMDGGMEAREEVVAVWGVVAADWQGKEGFANGILGLEEEDLDEVVKRVVEGL